MSSATMILLLAFVAQVAADGHSSTDELADVLFNNLLDRAAPVQSSSTLARRTDVADTALEATTMAKAAAVGNLAIGSRVPALVPALAVGRHRAAAPSVRASAMRLPGEPLEEASLARREALALGTLLGLGATFGGKPPKAYAADTTTFYGTAYPPASYKPYNIENPPKDEAVYEFDFPSDWEIDQPSKVDKGTKGIDSRLFNPKDRKMNEIVIVAVLARAGEDFVNFKALDKTTINGFGPSDAKLNDALAAADSLDVVERKGKGGLTYLEYDLRSSSNNYLASITSDQGKLFGLFIRASPSQFKKDEPKLRDMLASFRLTGRPTR